MKTSMRSGKITRRGVSLLLMMCLLITLLPASSVAATTVGAYGSVTVTTKNVVIRTSPAGSRTGYFAQKGTYPMIGPSYEVDGVTWYNLQTSDTGGFVSGNYATGNYGSAGMPATEKTYVDILANTVIIQGDDPTTPGAATPTIPAGTILQLVDGTPYSATVGGVTSTYINVYYYDGTTSAEYHTLYTNDFAKGIMTTDNLNNHISEVTWKASTAGLTRDDTADGDYYTHALQAALSILEYYDDDVDGNYGPLTEAAVMEFRADNPPLDPSSNVADATVFDKLFDQAVVRLAYLRSTPGLSGDPTTTPTVNMIQTTVEKLRIRKSYSTSSAYVGRIEDVGTILTYTRTHVSGSVTWYYIQYQGTYGWIMGTYVSAYSPTTGGTGTSTPVTNYGTVTITKKLVAIRTAANGSRSGYHVNTGDVCTMIGPSVEAGGYTWYNIRTESGRTGYVRGDCATPDFGSAGMPGSDASYVQFLYDSMVITAGNSPASAGASVTLPKNTVLQLVNGTSYPSGTTNYINVYYNNAIYHTEYTTGLTDGLMNEDNVNSYISNTIWPQGFSASEVAGLDGVSGVNIHLGDIRVHAVQAALWQLGLYDDKMDGDFGSKTNTGVVKFKQDNSITPADSKVDTNVSVDLFAQAIVALQLKLTTAPDTGDGTVPSSGTFGTVNTVKKGSWQEIDGSSRSLFPKGTVATVMLVNNPSKVFRIYRWSGANHADCVPYDAADTQILSAALGVSYTGAPSSSELSQVIASGSQDWPDYTWPKFRWAGSTLSSAYKVPVWVNLNGTVYCASIYVIPHGFTGAGTSGFTSSKLNGEYFHERNNMYGMLCVHFYGSTTHASGIMDPTHMANISQAYNAAASQFGASKVQ